MYISDNEKQSSSILKPKVHLTHHPHVKFPSKETVEVHYLTNMIVTIIILSIWMFKVTNWKFLKVD